MFYFRKVFSYFGSIDPHELAKVILHLLILSTLTGLESENEQGEFKLLVAMKRLYAFYQAHDITDLADIEKDVSAIITKGQ